jgi:hypothetical protein
MYQVSFQTDHDFYSIDTDSKMQANTMLERMENDPSILYVEVIDSSQPVETKPKPVKSEYGTLVKETLSKMVWKSELQGEYPWSSYHTILVTDRGDNTLIASRNFDTEINPSGETQIDYFIRTFGD